MSEEVPERGRAQESWPTEPGAIINPSKRMLKKRPSPSDTLPAPMEMVTRRIYLIRGQKVILDADLAQLYRVETRALVQAVKRNLERFPGDFMFQVSRQEAAAMR